MSDEYAAKYLDDLAEKNHNLEMSWDMREAVRMGRDALRDRIARQKPQPLTGWISVKDMLPKNETTVLICATRKFENREIRIISKALHTDGEHNTETSSLCWDSGDMNWEHDDEADADIIPEGWWEDADYVEQFAAVDDFVTHWMPLPEPPGREVSK